MAHVLVARLDNAGDVLLAGPAVRAVAAGASEVTLWGGPRGRGGAHLLPGGDRAAGDGADWAHPHLTVADLSCLGCLDDHVDHVVDVGVVHQDLQPGLRHQIDGVLRAPVDLGVTLLTAVPAGLGDRHALHSEGLQCAADLVQLERLDHRSDELHACTLLSLAPADTEAWLLLGPAAGVNSYPASTCTARSMPPTSASSLTRNPTVRWMRMPRM